MTGNAGRKIKAGILVAAFFIFLCAMYGGAQKKENLLVWSFTDQLRDIIDNYYEQWASDNGDTNDLSSNINVINKIKNRYSEPFLGGQNHYAMFAEIALTVNGKTTQQSDQVIDDFFKEAVDAFVQGVKTKSQALADFKEQVNTQYGW